MRASAALMLFFLAAPAHAASSIDLAQQLGGIIGAESHCGYVINADAVKAYIEKRIKADDLDFARWLDTEIWSTENHFADKTALAKMAFCTQVTRNAKALGLVK